MRKIQVRSPNYKWSLEIPDDGKNVIWVGMERGPLSLHFENQENLVLKEAGHQWYWNQYNGQKYEPAKFIVFRKEYETRIPYATGGNDAVRPLAAVQILFEFYLKENEDNLRWLKIY